MQETQFIPAINLDALDGAISNLIEIGNRIVAVVPGCASNYNTGYLVIYERGRNHEPR